MGNTTSKDDAIKVDGASLSLDELGGWDRPAIKRGDSLNKKLQWLQQAVRKQANVMEHELLKMPELREDFLNIPTSYPTERVHQWDTTFWSTGSKHRCTSTSGHEDNTSSQKQRTDLGAPSSKAQHCSWRKTVRKRIQERLRELKKEEDEDRRNNAIEETGQRNQTPVWRMNVLRAKVKIVLYLKKLMMEVREDKCLVPAVREESFPSYLTLMLGSCYPKFCQHQISMMTQEARRHVISTQGQYLSVDSSILSTNDCVDDLDGRSVFSIELNNDVRLVENEAGLESEMQKSTKQSLQMLKMFANRSNAKWVEAVSWTDPHVYDPNTLVLGRADIQIYHQLLIDFLQEGKIAFHLADSDIQAEVVSAGGEGKMEPVLSLDLWTLVKTYFPWKVPEGMRIEGMSVLCRRLLQMVVDVERLAGSWAVRKLKLVLCVDQSQAAFICNELVQYGFFGLSCENVLIVNMPRFNAMRCNSLSEMQLAMDSPKRAAGTGWSLLSLHWPKTAYTIDSQTNKPTPLATSALTWLEEKNVAWINSQLIADWERFSPDSAVDLDFCATALYCSDEKEANMAMEVVVCDTLHSAMTSGSVIFGKEENSRHCCEISTSDLMTPSIRAMLVEQEMKKRLFSCQQRYMFKVKALKNILSYPAMLFADIEVLEEGVYLNFKMGDITTANDAHCAAILRQHHGQRTTATVLQKSWFHSIGQKLLRQDTQSEFASFAANLSSLHGVSRKEDRQKHKAEGIVAVFVLNNLVSKRTVHVASCFAKQTNYELHILTSVTGEQHISSCMKFLEELKHDITLPESRVLCKAITRGSRNVIDVIEEYLETTRATLLVVGSENLAKSDTEYIGSFCMSVAKRILEIPVLIAKVNAIGQSHRSTAENCGVRCMIEARPNVMPLLQWILAQLDPLCDKVFIAKPRAIDHSESPTPAATRLLMTLQEKATVMGFPVVLRPLKGEPVQALDKAVHNDQIDLLALQINASKAFPAHAVEILRTVKSSVLIYRE